MRTTSKSSVNHVTPLWPACRQSTRGIGWSASALAVQLPCTASNGPHRVISWWPKYPFAGHGAGRTFPSSNGEVKGGQCAVFLLVQLEEGRSPTVTFGPDSALLGRGLVREFLEEGEAMPASRDSLSDESDVKFRSYDTGRGTTRVKRYRVTSAARSAWRSPITTWAFFLGCLVFAGLWFSSLHHLGDGVTPGTWAQWAAACGSTAAVVVALSAIIVQRRFQSLRERTALSAWMDLEADADGRAHWVVKAMNDTGLPIFAWTIESDGGIVHLCSQEQGPLVPDVNRYNPKLDWEPDPAGTLPLSVEFTDREGDSWRREMTGHLVRSAEPHPCPRLLAREGST